MPVLRGRPVASITRLELTANLKAVEARAPEVARNLRNHLWGIFEHAIDSGLIEDNPVPPVRVLRKRNQQNHPALDSTRLRDFSRQLDATDSLNIETRIAMQLVVLTACRKNEVVGARWSEFDLGTAAWEIPAERMRARRAHWVPLSRQAVAALHTLREVVPEESTFLFPNRVDPTRPMADRSLNAVIERLGYSGVGTPHGMRAAFSMHFNSAGASINVIEHCRAHVPANRVRAAYNRHSTRRSEGRCCRRGWISWKATSLRRTQASLRRTFQCRAPGASAATTLKASAMRRVSAKAPLHDRDRVLAPRIVLIRPHQAHKQL